MGFGAQGEALFPVCVALYPVGVDGSFYWVGNGGVAYFGEFVGKKLCPGHAGTVGELEFDFVAVSVDDAVEFVEGDDDLGVHRGPGAGVTAQDDGCGGVEQVGGVDGFEGAADISNDCWGVGDGDGVGALLAVGGT